MIKLKRKYFVDGKEVNDLQEFDSLAEANRIMNLTFYGTSSMVKYESVKFGTGGIEMNLHGEVIVPEKDGKPEHKFVRIVYQLKT